LFDRRVLDAAGPDPKDQTTQVGLNRSRECPVGDNRPSVIFCVPLPGQRQHGALSVPAVMTLFASKRPNRFVTNRVDRSLKSPWAHEADNEISKSFQPGRVCAACAGVVFDTSSSLGGSRGRETTQHLDHCHGRSARRAVNDARDAQAFRPAGSLVFAGLRHNTSMLPFPRFDHDRALCP
jgi:hypothetical protein